MGGRADKRILRTKGEWSYLPHRLCISFDSRRGPFDIALPHYLPVPRPIPCSPALFFCCRDKQARKMAPNCANCEGTRLQGPAQSSHAISAFRADQNPDLQATRDPGPRINVIHALQTPIISLVFQVKLWRWMTQTRPGWKVSCPQFPPSRSVALG